MVGRQIFGRTPYESVITIFISLVWLINGLFCKVLGLVPRHSEIVSRIVGADYAPQLTMAIGTSEVIMVGWILSGIKRRACAIFQIAVVGLMNIIEFVLVPDLLLFGRWNIVFASVFVIIVYIWEFKLWKPHPFALSQR